MLELIRSLASDCQACKYEMDAVGEAWACAQAMRYDTARSFALALARASARDADENDDIYQEAFDSVFYSPYSPEDADFSSRLDAARDAYQQARACYEDAFALLLAS